MPAGRRWTVRSSRETRAGLGTQAHAPIQAVTGRPHPKRPTPSDLDEHPPTAAVASGRGLPVSEIRPPGPADGSGEPTTTRRCRAGVWTVHDPGVPPRSDPCPGPRQTTAGLHQADRPTLRNLPGHRRRGPVRLTSSTDALRHRCLRSWHPRSRRGTPPPPARAVRDETRGDRSPGREPLAPPPSHPDRLAPGARPRPQPPVRVTPGPARPDGDAVRPARTRSGRRSDRTPPR